MVLQQPSVHGGHEQSFGYGSQSKQRLIRGAGAERGGGEQGAEGSRAVGAGC